MNVRRSSRISTPDELAVRRLPLRRADALPDFLLYWIPTNATPLPAAQRTWLNVFLERLSGYLTQKCGLRAEVFLEYKTIQSDLLESFIDQALDNIPLMGFGRKPGVPLPPLPTLKDLQPLIERKKPFDYGDYVGDYCYWFVVKNERKQRQMFFGHGGMTLMFMTQDSSTVPTSPPISPRMREHPAFKELFEKVDPAQVIATGQALKDKWLKQSIDLYGSDLPQSPQMKGIPFVIPLLKSANFLQDASERVKLASLCEFYVTESEQDGGVLLASPKDHEDAVLEILDEMRISGMDY